MKNKKLLTSLSLFMTISMLTIGCSNQEGKTNETKLTEESVPATESLPVITEESNQLIYGTVNLTYADFYYGELNDIEPDYEASTGNYEANSKVETAGFQEEGMYDAVTSATKQKSTRFAATFYEEEGEGANILGIANANVAISEDLYHDVQKAISEGTVCNNELIDIVSNMTVSDSVPAEFKVINPDGTLSKTIGETTSATDVTTTFSSISSWGNYQINFEGIELEVDQLIGGILETSDGTKYGLEHEDNLWLNPAELSFCVEPFTEPHGNEVAYNRFADMQGKTITKFTYMIANGPDIEIPLNAFVYYQLSDEYSASADETVIYDSEGTVIHYELIVPEESDYQLTSVKMGRSPLELSMVENASDKITLPADFGPGKYTLVFEDETYSGFALSTLVESGLKNGDVILEDNTIVFKNTDNFTSTQYIANIASVTVNNEPVAGRGLGSVLFDENGVLIEEAAIENEGKSTPIFADGENQVVITSTGFPDLTFTVTK